MFCIPPPPATFYTCPGDGHSIPRSVHLARLAGAYAKCHQCPHRNDHGLAVLNPFSGHGAPPQPAQSGWIAAPDGIRGRYLNDLTRQDAVRWGSALARLLWERHPLVGRRWTELPADEGAARPVARRSLTVVVGYDERPSSPDLAIGAVTGLRQSGCRVLDLGVVSKAEWSFVVQHLSADAGMMITGAGRDPSWTGFDIVGAAGEFLSATTDLPELISQARFTAGRLTRSAGSVATYAAAKPYMLHLRRQFHALRPLHVTCVTPSAVIGRSLQRTFPELPCRLHLDVGSQWQAPGPEHPALESRMAAAIVGSGGDVGMWIGEDGQTCAVFDETGRRAAVENFIPWLARSTVEDRPPEADRVFLAAGQAPPLNEDVWNVRPVSQLDAADSLPRSDRPWWLELPEASLAEFRQSLRRCQAAAGMDPSRRFWLGGAVPTCDAIVTLAAVLRALSWSDASLSQRLADDHPPRRAA
ncbi:MAG: hypothetical protein SFV23_21170 [Planctomycetaceae bacterium]|nr:hypothetical protein [Planctomycetaceae bacterium]